MPACVCRAYHSADATPCDKQSRTDVAGHRSLAIGDARSTAGASGRRCTLAGFQSLAVVFVSRVHRRFVRYGADSAAVNPGHCIDHIARARNLLLRGCYGARRRRARLTLRLKVPYRHSAIISFLALAVGQNVGVATLSGFVDPSAAVLGVRTLRVANYAPGHFLAVHRGVGRSDDGRTGDAGLVVRQGGFASRTTG